MKNFISHLKVIDLSSVLAGPSVAMYFAELGADVTKIEHPIHKDVTRSWKLSNEDASNPISAYFSSINYKKNYKSLNLKNEDHRLQLLELCENADILIMNFKKGDQKKFGIEDEVLHGINPKLIVAKINGYGEESDRVAYDLILQAETGFMSMNGTPNSGPVKMPVALIDVLAGHQLKEGILQALLNRTISNEGATVTVSLYEAAIASLVNQASNYLMNKHIPQRIGSLHPNIAPYGEIFKTKDNQLITFAIGNNNQFKDLCIFLNLGKMSSDERFSTNTARIEHRNSLASLWEAKILTLESEEILKFCLTKHIPAGVIKDLEKVFQNRKAQEMIRKEKISGISTQRVSSVAYKIK